MNNRIKTLLLLQLVLLVRPVFGSGRQAQAAAYKLEALVTRAQQAQAAQDYAAAANVYQQAVKIEPGMAELWVNLGLMQRQSGDRHGALLSFEHANRLNPSLYVPNLFLGIDYLREGKGAEAIPYLLKAQKLNANDPQAALALGRAYFSVRKYAAAAAQLERAAALDPKPGSTWFSLGIARLNEVEEDARVLSEEAKTSPFAGALYAESLHKQGRFGEAASLYGTLLDAHPQPPCLHSSLGFSLLRGHNEPEAASEFAFDRKAHPECGLALLGQARLSIDSADNASAARLLGELWGRDHGFVEANAGLLLEGLSSEKATAVTNYFLARDNAVVTADLRSALAAAFVPSGFTPSGPDAAEPVSTRASNPAEQSASNVHRTAEELYAAGQFQLCAGRLASGTAPLSQTPRNANRLRLLAACSFFAGDNQRASMAADALRALQPHSVEALYWSIQSNERLALKALARFQGMEPESSRSHVLLGDIYHQLERNDDAETEYKQALALTPNDPAAMLGLATAYLSNNNTDGAGEITRAALTRSPDDPELNLIMADVTLAHHEYAEALPFLEKSLRAKPQMLPRVHALMGRAYAELGRTQEAIAQLKLGESSDEDGAIQYLLARLYRSLGDSKNATAALEQMKTIKDQRRGRGVKQVEDPDLSPLESPPATAAKP